MKNLKLSIVTVNYKSWELLESYLKSFKQYPPQLSYEIIVVDNYPEDGMGESFAKKHPEIKLVSNKGNFGFSHGCNIGAEHACGEYLIFLNPDTELTEDNAIDVMVEFSDSHPEVGVVSCRTVTSKGIGREINFLSPWLLIPLLKQIYKLLNKERLKKKFLPDEMIWYPEWTTGSVVLISYQLFVKIGKWNDKRYWMYYEDPDLCIRVRKEGKEIALLRNVTIKHVDGGISRRTVESTIQSKIEVIISAHNYIQENTARISKDFLHLLYLFKTLSPALLLIILLPFFWVKKYEVKAQILFGSIKYYMNAIILKTWKSPKLYKDIG